MTTLTRTSTEKIRMPSGKMAHVPKCITSFQQWHGKQPDTYGGKAVLQFDGKPLFAELVVLRLLEKNGWRGVWVDSYKGKYREGMPDAREPVDLPERAEALLERIRTKAGIRGGCFDVFAWRGNSCRFVELKRAGKDHIQETQRRWLEAARASGLKMSDLLIVEWTTQD